MEVLNGYEFDAEKLDQACETLGLNRKVEDLDALCEQDAVIATYIDLRALADSNLVHMYHSNDNWEVDRLATYLGMHPFLYVEISLTKETEAGLPPYKMAVHSIKTLIDFYTKERPAGLGELMRNPMSHDVYYVEAEEHSALENKGSCRFKEFCRVY